METKPTQQKETKHPVEKGSVSIQNWISRKAMGEGVTAAQLHVYCWLYKKNGYARQQKGRVYGKPTYDMLIKEIESELGYGRADALLHALEKKGWLEKSHAKAYKGRRMVGYLCLLDKDDRAMARAAQQEMHLEDEEAVVEVESAVAPRVLKTYIYGGVRFYDDADGNPHQVPMSAPEPPTDTAVWCDDPEGWFEPDEIPERETDF